MKKNSVKLFAEGIKRSTILRRFHNSGVKQKGKNFTEKLIFRDLKNFAKNSFLGKKSLDRALLYSRVFYSKVRVNRTLHMLVSFKSCTYSHTGAFLLVNFTKASLENFHKISGCVLAVFSTLEKQNSEASVIFCTS